MSTINNVRNFVYYQIATLRPFEIYDEGVKFLRNGEYGIWNAVLYYISNELAAYWLASANDESLDGFIDRERLSSLPERSPQQDTADHVDNTASKALLGKILDNSSESNQFDFEGLDDYSI